MEKLDQRYKDCEGCFAHVDIRVLFLAMAFPMQFGGHCRKNVHAETFWTDQSIVNESHIINKIEFIFLFTVSSIMFNCKSGQYSYHVEFREYRFRIPHYIRPWAFGLSCCYLCEGRLLYVHNRLEQLMLVIQEIDSPQRLSSSGPRLYYNNNIFMGSFSRQTGHVIGMYNE